MPELRVLLAILMSGQPLSALMSLNAYCVLNGKTNYTWAKKALRIALRIQMMPLFNK